MSSETLLHSSNRKDHVRSLRQCGRIVVKFGSAVLTDDRGRLDPKLLRSLANDIAPLLNVKQWPTLVSSGAIAVGMGILKLEHRPQTMAGLQAAAAVGQSQLVEAWGQAFRRYQVPVAQILLTHADLSDRRRFLNARRALGAIEKQNAMAVINENDSVSCEEIAFGDNDELAAQVTNLIDAPLLLMLSSAPGILDDNGTRISAAPADHPYLDKIAKPHTSSVGTGGMISKLQAARIAAARGAHVAILPGKQTGIIDAFLAGEDVGTLLMPSEAQPSLRSRAHWIAHTLRPNGAIRVDPGAEDALRHKGKSLLAKGIVRVEGCFSEGESVEVSGLDPSAQAFARGLIRYSSDHLAKIIGEPSAEIPKTLGFSGGDAVIHRDDLVLLS